MAIRCTTLEVAADYCVSRTLGAIDYPEFQHPFITGIQSAIGFFWVLKYLPWLVPIVTDPSDQLVKWMPKLSSVFAFRREIQKDIDNILDNPDVLQKSEHSTVYEHLMTAPDEKERMVRFTRDDMFQEALGILMAGSDTVGHATTVGVFHVLYNKRILERLTAELREAWTDPESHVDYTYLEKLPYLVRKFIIDITELIMCPDGRYQRVPQIGPWCRQFNASCSWATRCNNHGYQCS